MIKTPVPPAKPVPTGNARVVGQSTAKMAMPVPPIPATHRVAVKAIRLFALTETNAQKTCVMPKKAANSLPLIVMTEMPALSRAVTPRS